MDIYADGEYMLTLSEDTVIDAGLKIGMELDAAALEGIERSSTFVRAKGKAYNYLSYGDMSVRTMKGKLARAGIPEDIACDVIDWLLQQGYLDDSRYAASLARYLADTKCYGPQRISQEMFAKGVDRETADAAIAALDTDFYETVKTHLPGKIDLSDRRAVARLYGQLSRRGFDSDMINSVIKYTEEFDD